MNAPLRLFAADYGLIVLQGDVLFMTRSTPAQIAGASGRILKGEPAGAVLGESAHAVPLREIWSLEGSLAGKDLELRWVGHRTFEVDFADRKSRDAALEGIAEALRVAPATVPGGGKARYLPGIAWVLLGILSGWAYVVTGRRLMLALVGMAGVWLLRLLYGFLHPPRRRRVEIRK